MPGGMIKRSRNMDLNKRGKNPEIITIEQQREASVTVSVQRETLVTEVHMRHKQVKSLRDT